MTIEPMQWQMQTNHTEHEQFYEKINEIIAAINALPQVGMDAVPTEGSENAAMSGGIYSAEKSISDTAAAAQTRAAAALNTANSALDETYQLHNLINGVGAIAEDAQTKVNTVYPLDAAPAEGSTKGVTSGGVYDAIAAAGGVTDITDSVTPCTEDIEVLGGKVYAAGRLVIVDLYIHNTNTSTGVKNMVTMPAGYRPAADSHLVYFPYTTTASYYTMYSTLNADTGIISGGYALPKSGYAYVYGTYVIADA